MFQDAFIEHSQISCSTTNVYDGNTCFQVLVAHYSSSRRQWLQYQVFCDQPCFFNTAVDVADCIFITGDDVEIGSHFHTAVTNRVRNILEIIYCKFLWNNIDDLITCRNISTILIRHQPVDFFLTDFFFYILTNDIAPGLQTFNMMTGDTYIYFTNLEIRIGCIAVFQCSLNGFDGLINVQHHSMLNAIAVGPAETKDLQLTKFIFSSGNSGNLGCSDV